MHNLSNNPVLDHQILTAVNAGIGLGLKSKMGSEAPLPERLQHLMMELARRD